MAFKRNKSLKRLSTFCIGGTAEYFFESGNPRYVAKAIAEAEEKKIPWRAFGEGSNMLFPDRAIKGLLIRIFGGTISKTGTKLLVSAGVPLEKVVAASIRSGLQGVECLSGIPGTVGGAIVGNAGAYGHSISEIVSRVEILEPGGIVRWVRAAECGFSYRESSFKHRRVAILRAELSLKKGKKAELLAKSKRILAERAKKYPKGLKCPGSFFKNPLIVHISRSSMKKIDATKVIDGKIPAGYLLEEVGAKGMRVGDICVADYHGNLFINMGKGTEAQAKKLSMILKERVKRKFGIALNEEVRAW